MNLGMNIFVALLLLKVRCSHFVYYGEQSYLKEMERISVRSGEDRFEFGKILGHTSWEDFRRDFRPQFFREQLVVIDESVGLDEHEKLTSQLAEFLDTWREVSITLIRLTDEDCDRLQAILTHSSRISHENLKLMYTCLADKVHKLLLIDAQLSRANCARPLRKLDKTTKPETVFTYDEKIGSEATDLEEYDFCPWRCSLYCLNPYQETNITIGAHEGSFEISAPSNLAINTTHKSTHPIIGPITCLDCSIIEHGPLEMPIPPYPGSNSLSKYAMHQVIGLVTLLVFHCLINLSL